MSQWRTQQNNGDSIFPASPTRLAVARELRGLTRKSLAENAGLSPSAITRFEQMTRGMEPSTLTNIADALGFPADFFYGEELDLFDDQNLTFRSRRSMTATLRAKAKAVASVTACIISPYIRSKFMLPQLHLPDDLSDFSPERAASLLRCEWRLASGPLPNLVQICEAHGIEIYWMNEAASSVDAFSFWRNDQPFIILNSNKPFGDRARYDLAHELGHLILHRESSDLDSRLIEAQANEFAAHFLMPADQFVLECPKYPIVADFIPLKLKWGVSIAAMLRRTRDLGVISDWQYESACKDMAIRGMKITEPNPLMRENSYLHNLVFGKLYAKSIYPADFAHDIGLQLNDLCQIMPIAANFDDTLSFAPEQYDLRLFNVNTN